MASWDKHIYLYDTSSTGGQLLNKFEHRAPILDVCFGETEEEAYTAGLDWDVQRWATNLLLLLGRKNGSHKLQY